MSQENVEVVKAAYAAFARGGLDRWMEHFTDDVYLRPVEGYFGPLHGKVALRAYFQDWIDTFEGFWMEPVELIDAGEDKLCCVDGYGGRATLSGVETDQTEAEVYTLRDGKILRVDEYAHRDEALEAAGLRE